MRLLRPIYKSKVCMETSYTYCIQDQSGTPKRCDAAVHFVSIYSI